MSDTALATDAVRVSSQACLGPRATRPLPPGFDCSDRNCRQSCRQGLLEMGRSGFDSCFARPNAAPWMQRYGQELVQQKHGACQNHVLLSWRSPPPHLAAQPDNIDQKNKTLRYRVQAAIRLGIWPTGVWNKLIGIQPSLFSPTPK